MIILDASVLIAHLESSDIHHVRATALLLDHCDDEFGCSAITLAEVLVGAIRVGRGDQARKALADMGVQSIGLPADSAVELAQLRVRTGLKLSDCFVIHAAQIQRGAKVGTFDARLAAAAAALGVPAITG